MNTPLFSGQINRSHTMRFTIVVSLSENEAQTFRQNSLERVLNNAIHCGQLGETRFKNQLDREKASTLWQDVEEVKPLLDGIWKSVQNEIFKRSQTK
jgi:hypothetical protein